MCYRDVMTSDRDRAREAQTMTNAYLFMVGTGCALLIAGIVQIFNQAINTRQAKMGAVRAKFDFKRLSFQSIYPGIVLLAIGALLLILSSFAVGR
jgi:hypothetical protein